MVVEGVFYVGDRVTAPFRGSRHRYPGKISKDRGNGRFDIEFDDGDFEANIQKRDIELETSKSNKSPKVLSNNTALKNGQGTVETFKTLKATRIEVGDFVRVKQEAGQIHRGYVMRKRLGGTYDIKLEDGSMKQRIRSSQISTIDSLSDEEVDLDMSASGVMEGMKVEIKLRGRPSWLEAEVKRKHQDGSCDVVLKEDGSCVAVARNRIRSVSDTLVLERENSQQQITSPDKVQVGQLVTFKPGTTSKVQNAVVLATHDDGSVEIQLDNERRPLTVDCHSLTISDAPKSSSGHMGIEGEVRRAESGKLSQLTRGDQVRFLSEEDNHWRVGSVARCRLDGTFDIRYQDNTVRSVSERNIKLLRHVTEDENEGKLSRLTCSLRVECTQGDRVLYRKIGQRQQRKGKVLRKRSDGTYDIEGDDGSRALRIPWSRVSLIADGKSPHGESEGGSTVGSAPQLGKSVSFYDQALDSVIGGEVVRIRSDGTFDIKGTDGSKRLRVKSRDLRATSTLKNHPNSSLEPSGIKDGDKVLVLNGMETESKEGAVIRGRLDGTFVIKYDDGEVETRVERERLQPSIDTVERKTQSTASRSMASNGLTLIRCNEHNGLEKGCRVQFTDVERGHELLGTISETHTDGSYAIVCEGTHSMQFKVKSHLLSPIQYKVDGLIEEAVQRKMAIVRPTDFNIGDHVRCNWQDQGQKMRASYTEEFKSGTVLAIHADDTLTIKYENGIIVDNAPRDTVWMLKRESGDTNTTHPCSLLEALRRFSRKPLSRELDALISYEKESPCGLRLAVIEEILGRAEMRNLKKAYQSCAFTLEDQENIMEVLDASEDLGITTDLKTIREALSFLKAHTCRENIAKQSSDWTAWSVEGFVILICLASYPELMKTHPDRHAFSGEVYQPETVIATSRRIGRLAVEGNSRFIKDTSRICSLDLEQFIIPPEGRFASKNELKAELGMWRARLGHGFVEKVIHEYSSLRKDSARGRITAKYKSTTTFDGSARPQRRAYHNQERESCPGARPLVEEVPSICSVLGCTLDLKAFRRWQERSSISSDSELFLEDLLYIIATFADDIPFVDKNIRADNGSLCGRGLQESYATGTSSPKSSFTRDPTGRQWQHDDDDGKRPLPLISSTVTQLVKSNRRDLAIIVCALKTVYTIVDNLLSNPCDIRCYRIREQNKTYQAKVGCLRDSKNLMESVGFRHLPRMKAFIFEQPHLTDSLQGCTKEQPSALSTGKDVDPFREKDKALESKISKGHSQDFDQVFDIHLQELFLFQRKQDLEDAIKFVEEYIREDDECSSSDERADEGTVSADAVKDTGHDSKVYSLDGLNSEMTEVEIQQLAAAKQVFASMDRGKKGYVTSMDFRLWRKYNGFRCSMKEAEEFLTRVQTRKNHTQSKETEGKQSSSLVSASSEGGSNISQGEGSLQNPRMEFKAFVQSLNPIFMISPLGNAQGAIERGGSLTWKDMCESREEFQTKLKGTNEDISLVVGLMLCALPGNKVYGILKEVRDRILSIVSNPKSLQRRCVEIDQFLHQDSTTKDNVSPHADKSCTGWEQLKLYLGPRGGYALEKELSSSKWGVRLLSCIGFQLVPNKKKAFIPPDAPDQKVGDMMLTQLRKRARQLSHIMRVLIFPDIPYVGAASLGIACLGPSELLEDNTFFQTPLFDRVQLKAYFGGFRSLYVKGKVQLDVFEFLADERSLDLHPAKSSNRVAQAYQPLNDTIEKGGMHGLCLLRDVAKLWLVGCDYMLRHIQEMLKSPEDPRARVLSVAEKDVFPCEESDGNDVGHPLELSQGSVVRNKVCCCIMSFLVNIGYREGENQSLFLPYNTSISFLRARAVELEAGIHILQGLIVSARNGVGYSSCSVQLEPTEKVENVLRDIACVSAASPTQEECVEARQAITHRVESKSFDDSSRPRPDKGHLGRKNVEDRTGNTRVSEESWIRIQSLEKEVKFLKNAIISSTSATRGPAPTDALMDQEQDGHMNHRITTTADIHTTASSTETPARIDSATSSVHPERSCGISKSGEAEKTPSTVLGNDLTKFTFNHPAWAPNYLESQAENSLSLTEPERRFLHNQKQHQMRVEKRSLNIGVSTPRTKRVMDVTDPDPDQERPYQGGRLKGALTRQGPQSQKASNILKNPAKKLKILRNPSSSHHTKSQSTGRVTEFGKQATALTFINSLISELIDDASLEIAERTRSRHRGQVLERFSKSIPLIASKAYKLPFVGNSEMLKIKDTSSLVGESRQSDQGRFPTSENLQRNFDAIQDQGHLLAADKSTSTDKKMENLYCLPFSWDMGKIFFLATNGSGTIPLLLLRRYFLVYATEKSVCLASDSKDLTHSGTCGFENYFESTTNVGYWAADVLRLIQKIESERELQGFSSLLGVLYFYWRSWALTKARDSLKRKSTQPMSCLILWPQLLSLLSLQRLKCTNHVVQALFDTDRVGFEQLGYMDTLQVVRNHEILRNSLSDSELTELLDLFLVLLMDEDSNSRISYSAMCSANLYLDGVPVEVPDIPLERAICGWKTSQRFIGITALELTVNRTIRCFREGNSTPGHLHLERGYSFIDLLMYRIIRVEHLSVAIPARVYPAGSLLEWKSQSFRQFQGSERGPDDPWLHAVNCGPRHNAGKRDDSKAGLPHWCYGRSSAMSYDQRELNYWDDYASEMRRDVTFREFYANGSLDMIALSPGEIFVPPYLPLVDSFSSSDSFCQRQPKQESREPKALSEGRHLSSTWMANTANREASQAPNGRLKIVDVISRFHHNDSIILLEDGAVVLSDYVRPTVSSHVNHPERSVLRSPAKSQQPQQVLEVSQLSRCIYFQEGDWMSKFRDGRIQCRRYLQLWRNTRDRPMQLEWGDMFILNTSACDGAIHLIHIPSLQKCAKLQLIAVARNPTPCCEDEFSSSILEPVGQPFVRNASHGLPTSPMFVVDFCISEHLQLVAFTLNSTPTIFIRDLLFEVEPSKKGFSGDPSPDTPHRTRLIRCIGHRTPGARHCWNGKTDLLVSAGNGQGDSQILIWRVTETSPSEPDRQYNTNLAGRVTSALGVGAYTAMLDFYPLRRFSGHPGGHPISALSVSSDLNIAVSAGADGKIMLWDLSEHEVDERIAGKHVQSRDASFKSRLLSERAAVNPLLILKDGSDGVFETLSFQRLVLLNCRTVGERATIEMDSAKFQEAHAIDERFQRPRSRSTNCVQSSNLDASPIERAVGGVLYITDDQIYALQTEHFHESLVNVQSLSCFAHYYMGIEQWDRDQGEDVRESTWRLQNHKTVNALLTGAALEVNSVIYCVSSGFKNLHALSSSMKAFVCNELSIEKISQRVRANHGELVRFSSTGPGQMPASRLFLGKRRSLSSPMLKGNAEKTTLPSGECNVSRACSVDSNISERVPIQVRDPKHCMSTGAVPGGSDALYKEEEEANPHNLLVCAHAHCIPSHRKIDTSLAKSDILETKDEATKKYFRTQSRTANVIRVSSVLWEAFPDNSREPQQHALNVDQPSSMEGRQRTLEAYSTVNIPKTDIPAIMTAYERKLYASNAKKIASFLLSRNDSKPTIKAAADMISTTFRRIATNPSRYIGLVCPLIERASIAFSDAQQTLVCGSDKDNSAPRSTGVVDPSDVLRVVEVKQMTHLRYDRKLKDQSEVPFSYIKRAVYSMMRRGDPICWTYLEPLLSFIDQSCESNIRKPNAEDDCRQTTAVRRMSERAQSTHFTRKQWVQLVKAIASEYLFPKELENLGMLLRRYTASPTPDFLQTQHWNQRSAVRRGVDLVGFKLWVESLDPFLHWKMIAEEAMRECRILFLNTPVYGKSSVSVRNSKLLRHFINGKKTFDLVREKIRQQHFLIAAAERWLHGLETAVRSPSEAENSLIFENEEVKSLIDNPVDPGPGICSGLSWMNAQGTRAVNGKTSQYSRWKGPYMVPSLSCQPTYTCFLMYIQEERERHTALMPENVNNEGAGKYESSKDAQDFKSCRRLLFLKFNPGYPSEHRRQLGLWRKFQESKRKQYLVEIYPASEGASAAIQSHPEFGFNAGLSIRTLQNCLLMQDLEGWLPLSEVMQYRMVGMEARIRWAHKILVILMLLHDEGLYLRKFCLEDFHTCPRGSRVKLVNYCNLFEVNKDTDYLLNVSHGETHGRPTESSSTEEIMEFCRRKATYLNLSHFALNLWSLVQHKFADGGKYMGSKGRLPVKCQSFSEKKSLMVDGLQVASQLGEILAKISDRHHRGLCRGKPEAESETQKKVPPCTCSDLMELVSLCRSPNPVYLKLLSHSFFCVCSESCEDADNSLRSHGDLDLEKDSSNVRSGMLESRALKNRRPTTNVCPFVKEKFEVLRAVSHGLSRDAELFRIRQLPIERGVEIIEKLSIALRSLEIPPIYTMRSGMDESRLTALGIQCTACSTTSVTSTFLHGATMCGTRHLLQTSLLQDLLMNGLRMARWLREKILVCSGEALAPTAESVLSACNLLLDSAGTIFESLLAFETACHDCRWRSFECCQSSMLLFIHKFLSSVARISVEHLEIRKVTKCLPCHDGVRKRFSESTEKPWISKLYYKLEESSWQVRSCHRHSHVSPRTRSLLKDLCALTELASQRDIESSTYADNCKQTSQLAGFWCRDLAFKWFISVSRRILGDLGEQKIRWLSAADAYGTDVETRPMIVNLDILSKVFHWATKDLEAFIDRASERTTFPHGLDLRRRQQLNKSVMAPFRTRLKLIMEIVTLLNALVFTALDIRILQGSTTNLQRSSRLEELRQFLTGERVLLNMLKIWRVILASYTIAKLAGEVESKSSEPTTGWDVLQLRESVLREISGFFYKMSSTVGSCPAGSSTVSFMSYLIRNWMDHNAMGHLCFGAIELLEQKGTDEPSQVRLGRTEIFESVRSSLWNLLMQYCPLNRLGGIADTDCRLLKLCDLPTPSATHTSRSLSETVGELSSAGGTWKEKSELVSSILFLLRNRTSISQPPDSSAHNRACTWQQGVQNESDALSSSADSFCLERCLPSSNVVDDALEGVWELSNREFRFCLEHIGSWVRGAFDTWVGKMSLAESTEEVSLGMEGEELQLIEMSLELLAVTVHYQWQYMSVQEISVDNHADGERTSLANAEKGLARNSHDNCPSVDVSTNPLFSTVLNLLWESVPLPQGLSRVKTQEGSGSIRASDKDWNMLHRFLLLRNKIMACLLGALITSSNTSGVFSASLEAVFPNLTVYLSRTKHIQERGFSVPRSRLDMLELLKAINSQGAEILTLCMEASRATAGHVVQECLNSIQGRLATSMYLVYLASFPMCQRNRSHSQNKLHMASCKVQSRRLNEALDWIMHRTVKNVETYLIREESKRTRISSNLLTTSQASGNFIQMMQRCLNVSQLQPFVTSVPALHLEEESHEKPLRSSHLLLPPMTSVFFSIYGGSSELEQVLAGVDGIRTMPQLDTNVIANNMLMRHPELFEAASLLSYVADPHSASRRVKGQLCEEILARDLLGKVVSQLRRIRSAEPNGKERARDGAIGGQNVNDMRPKHKEHIETLKKNALLLVLQLLGRISDRRLALEMSRYGMPLLSENHSPEEGERRAGLKPSSSSLPHRRLREQKLNNIKIDVPLSDFEEYERDYNSEDFLEEPFRQQAWTSWYDSLSATSDECCTQIAELGDNISEPAQSATKNSSELPNSNGLKHKLGQRLVKPRTRDLDRSIGLQFSPPQEARDSQSEEVRGDESPPPYDWNSQASTDEDSSNLVSFASKHNVVGPIDGDGIIDAPAGLRLDSLQAENAPDGFLFSCGRLKSSYDHGHISRMTQTTGHCPFSGSPTFACSPSPAWPGQDTSNDDMSSEDTEKVEKLEKVLSNSMTRVKAGFAQKSELAGDVYRGSSLSSSSPTLLGSPSNSIRNVLLSAPSEDEDTSEGYLSDFSDSLEFSSRLLDLSPKNGANTIAIESYSSNDKAQEQAVHKHTSEDRKGDTHRESSPENRASRRRPPAIKLPEDLTTDEEVSQSLPNIQRLFSFLDSDGDGVLSVTDMLHGALEISRSQIDSLLRTHDVDQIGGLSLNAFATAVKDPSFSNFFDRTWRGRRLKLDSEEYGSTDSGGSLLPNSARNIEKVRGLQRVFGEYDLFQDGELSLEELRIVFNSQLSSSAVEGDSTKTPTMQQVSDEEILQWIQARDKSGSGTVTLEEFIDAYYVDSE